MPFDLIKLRGLTRYKTLDEAAEHGSDKSSNSRTSSPGKASDAFSSPMAGSRMASHASAEDMIDLTSGETTPSPTSDAMVKHERTFSDESATSQWTSVLAPAFFKPARRPPPIPETMETHLARLSPSADQQRAHIARGILNRAVLEWKKEHPTPVSVENMTVQSFKHVHLEDDTAGRMALICTGAFGAAQMAENFWSLARRAILEVYIVPRPRTSQSSRSVFYPQARALIAHDNPALDKWLSCIEGMDYSHGKRTAILDRLADAGLAG